MRTENLLAETTNLIKDILGYASKIDLTDIDGAQEIIDMANAKLEQEGFELDSEGFWHEV
jgi:hypothetical protein